MLSSNGRVMNSCKVCISRQSAAAFRTIRLGERTDSSLHNCVVGSARFKHICISFT